jgi:hypothetical protein
MKPITETPAHIPPLAPSERGWYAPPAALHGFLNPAFSAPDFVHVFLPQIPRSPVLHPRTLPGALILGRPHVGRNVFQLPAICHPPAEEGARSLSCLPRPQSPLQCRHRWSAMCQLPARPYRMRATCFRQGKAQGSPTQSSGRRRKP